MHRRAMHFHFTPCIFISLHAYSFHFMHIHFTPCIFISLHAYSFHFMHIHLTSCTFMYSFPCTIIRRCHGQTNPYQSIHVLTPDRLRSLQCRQDLLLVLSKNYNRIIYVNQVNVSDRELNYLVDKRRVNLLRQVGSYLHDQAIQSLCDFRLFKKNRSADETSSTRETTKNGIRTCLCISKLSAQLIS